MRKQRGGCYVYENLFVHFAHSSNENKCDLRRDVGRVKLRETSSFPPYSRALFAELHFIAIIHNCARCRKSKKETHSHACGTALISCFNTFTSRVGGLWKQQFPPKHKFCIKAVCEILEGGLNLRLAQIPCFFNTKASLASLNLELEINV